MPLASERPSAAEPPARIHDHAMESLRVIRDAMERAGSFKAVPGHGTVLIGLTALVAAALAARAPSAGAWLAIWLGEGLVAGAISVTSIVRKCRRLGLPLASGIVRKFALAFLPALAAGGILTGVLARQSLGAMLPGTWLLLYGAAVAAAGALSVRIVPLMGLTFMLLGVGALALAPAHPDLFLAAGFGGLHVVFGILIARRHGG